MSRVYYREPHLQGDFTLTNRIKIADLQSILNKNSQREMPSQLIEIPKSSYFEALKGRGNRFRYALINSSEQLYQTPDRGFFYAPKSIVFFDKKDYYYPSLYYFVSVIGWEFEIRQCNAGAGTLWTDIANLHEPLTDKKILLKIENSIEGIKRYLGE